MMLRGWWLTGALLLLGAAHAQSQTPVNPTVIEFDHSDFAQTEKYVIGYFVSATATSPVQEVDWPKPMACAPCTGPLLSRPTAFQTWYVAVRAVAGAVTSDWSPKGPFQRSPLAPQNLKVR